MLDRPIRSAAARSCPCSHTHPRPLSCDGMVVLVLVFGVKVGVKVGVGVGVGVGLWCLWWCSCYC